jgi:hypothetical protein
LIEGIELVVFEETERYDEQNQENVPPTDQVELLDFTFVEVPNDVYSSNNECNIDEDIQVSGPSAVLIDLNRNDSSVTRSHNDGKSTILNNSCLVFKLKTFHLYRHYRSRRYRLCS